MDRREKSVDVIRQCIVIFLSAAILFSVIVVCKEQITGNASSRYGGSAVTLDEGWFRVLPDGGEIPFSSFDMNIPGDLQEYGNSLTLRHDLSFGDSIGNTIGFYVESSAVKASLNGMQIYNCGTEDDVRNGKMLGHYYAIIPVTAKGTVEITLMSRGDTIQVYGVSYGPYETLSTNVTRTGLGALFMAETGFAVILLLIIVALTAKAHKVVSAKQISLILFILVSSVWWLTDSQILVLYLDKIDGIALLSYEAFALLPIAFSMYLYDSSRHLRKGDLIFALAGVVSFVVQNILHFMDIASFASTVIISRILISITLTFTFTQVIIDYVKDRDKFRKWLLISFCILIGSVGIQFVDSLTRHNMGTNSMFFRIGFTFFVLIQYVYYIAEVFALAEEGYKAENYLRMARNDSMTGLANRFAMEMDMKDLISQKDEAVTLGCVMCDLNNLKKTNDTLGHVAGDEIICGVAQCLTRVFEGIANIYRVGGDEFYVMMRNPKHDMAVYLKKLNAELTAYNQEHAIKINCSAGYTLKTIQCNEATIKQLMMESDRNMYTSKKMYHMVVEDGEIKDASPLVVGQPLSWESPENSDTEE